MISVESSRNEIILTAVIIVITSVFGLPDITFMILSLVLVGNVFFVKSKALRIIFLCFYITLFLLNIFVFRITTNHVLLLLSFMSPLLFPNINITFIISYLVIVVMAMIFIFKKNDNVFYAVPITAMFVVFTDSITIIFTPSFVSIIPALIVIGCCYVFLFLLLFHATFLMIFLSSTLIRMFVNERGFYIKIR